MATKKTTKAEETVEQVITTEAAETADETAVDASGNAAEAEEDQVKLYKVKVKITFRDKNSGEIVRAGKVIMVDQNRYKELTEKKKFVEKM